MRLNCTPPHNDYEKLLMAMLSKILKHLKNLEDFLLYKLAFSEPQACRTRLQKASKYLLLAIGEPFQTDFVLLLLIQSSDIRYAKIKDFHL